MTREAKTKKAASKGGRRSTAKVNRSRPPAATSRILEHVAAEHGMSALRVIAERHPQLVPEIERIVRDLTHDVRSGQARPGGPARLQGRDGTAWGVVTRTIQQFVDAVRRLFKMELPAAALIHGEGELLCLSRADQKDVGELFEWAPLLRGSE